ncbi:MAG TPA: hypothetical protein VFA50_00670 [Stellaceae bacterium]|nr:hypothetical protein [Stellaceae bacterium]
MVSTFSSRTFALMRDIQADWKHWSRAERIAAMLLMTAFTIAIGTLCYIQV